MSYFCSFTESTAGRLVPDTPGINPCPVHILGSVHSVLQMLVMQGDPSVG